jgi:2-(1,2-epoxy-1,2-dihydrophenyl)acetyl-CoA isomerase
MSEAVELIREGQIAVVMMNRPEKYNALNLEEGKLALKVLISLSMDDSVRGIVISGKGKAFCAGADLKWFSSLKQDLATTIHQFAGQMHQLVLVIRRMRKPVIAAINGVAAGGGLSLALACDFRIMARTATLLQAYTSAGLSIDGGGTFSLPRLVGLARAMEIAAFDRPITGEQALAWGLVTKVVADDGVLKEATDMAKELAERSVNSFGWVKQLLADSFNMSLEKQLEHEQEALRHCANHADGREGVRAFVEKRKPVFNVRLS